MNLSTVSNKVHKCAIVGDAASCRYHLYKMIHGALHKRLYLNVHNVHLSKEQHHHKKPVSFLLLISWTGQIVTRTSTWNVFYSVTKQRFGPVVFEKVIISEFRGLNTQEQTPTLNVSSLSSSLTLGAVSCTTTTSMQSSLAIVRRYLILSKYIL